MTPLVWRGILLVCLTFVCVQANLEFIRFTKCAKYGDYVEEKRHCYKKCSLQYTGAPSNTTLCVKDCPRNFYDYGLHCGPPRNKECPPEFPSVGRKCEKPSYNRGEHFEPGCEASQVSYDGYCYVKEYRRERRPPVSNHRCSKADSYVHGVCWEKCIFQYYSVDFPGNRKHCVFNQDRFFS